VHNIIFLFIKQRVNTNSGPSLCY